jgi:hypothetical protein
MNLPHLKIKQNSFIISYLIEKLIVSMKFIAFKLLKSSVFTHFAHFQQHALNALNGRGTASDRSLWSRPCPATAGIDRPASGTKDDCLIMSLSSYNPVG